MAAATRRAGGYSCEVTGRLGVGRALLGLAEPPLAELPGARGPQLATARGRADVFLGWPAGAVHAVQGRLCCGRDLTGGLRGRTFC